MRKQKPSTEFVRVAWTATAREILVAAAFYFISRINVGSLSDELYVSVGKYRSSRGEVSEVKYYRNIVVLISTTSNHRRTNPALLGIG